MSGLIFSACLWLLNRRALKPSYAAIARLGRDGWKLSEFWWELTYIAGVLFGISYLMLTLGLRMAGAPGRFHGLFFAGTALGFWAVATVANLVALFRWSLPATNRVTYLECLYMGICSLLAVLCLLPWEDPVTWRGILRLAGDGICGLGALGAFGVLLCRCHQ